MWATSMYALLGLCGLVAIRSAVSMLRSPPERGRPDSMQLYLNHFFACFGVATVGTVFTAASIAALFFGYPLGVPPWQHIASVALLALTVATVKFAWKKMSERQRP